MVRKQKCHFNFISTFNKITLITLFISYIVNTCAGIDTLNTKILTYEMKCPFYFSIHIQYFMLMLTHFIVMRFYNLSK